MSHFNVEVEHYMSSPALSVTPDTLLDEVYEKMQETHISSLGVTEGDKLVGVITRTDLLRLGHRQAGKRRGAELLTLPSQKVSEVMTTELVTVAPGSKLDQAADLMLRGRLHRVYVVDGDQLKGVLSTRDVMSAIHDKRLNKPISAFMSSPIFSVRAGEPISLASERLEKARVSGLVVLDDRYPVGVFTQSVALACKELPRETPIEEVMSSAILLLSPHTPIFRAAAQAAAMEVRRVIVWDGKKVDGILTGLDFARAASPQTASL